MRRSPAALAPWADAPGDVARLCPLRRPVGRCGYFGLILARAPPRRPPSDLTPQHPAPGSGAPPHTSYPLMVLGVTCQMLTCSLLCARLPLTPSTNRHRGISHSPHTRYPHSAYIYSSQYIAIRNPSQWAAPARSYSLALATGKELPPRAHTAHMCMCPSDDRRPLAICLSPSLTTSTPLPLNCRALTMRCSFHEKSPLKTGLLIPLPPPPRRQPAAA
jgi:hypothetical protein